MLIAQGFVAPLWVQIVWIFDNVMEDRISGVDFADDVVLQAPSKGEAPERRPVPSQTVIAFRIAEKVAFQLVGLAGGPIRAADRSAVLKSEATGESVAEHRVEGGATSSLPRHIRL